ncbi:MAG: flippase-like domain-containing protein [Magnetococcales bacterium]|nr:flippase-like domain-containing protein [Magnetococcales bacterium]
MEKIGGFTVKLLTLLLGVLIVVILFNFLDISYTEMLISVKNIPPPYLIIYAFFQASFIFLLSHRWKLLVFSAEPDLIYKRGFFFCCISFSNLMNSFMLGPAASVSTKSLALKVIHKISIKKGVFIALTEHALNIFIVGLSILSSILAYLKLGPPLLNTVVCTLLPPVAVLAILYKFDFFREAFFAVIGVVERIMRHLLPKIISKFNGKGYLLIVESFFKQAKFKQSLFFSLLIYYLIVCKAFFLATALNLDLNFLQFLLFYPFIYLTGAFGPTPGSLGFLEMGWVGILSLHGIDAQTAMTFALVKRVMDDLLEIILGLLGYIYYNWRIVTPNI